MNKFLLIFTIIFCACSAPNKKYEFNLQSVDKNVTLSDLKGQNLIVYFGYTFCPDVCPTTLAIVSNVLKKNGLENSYKIVFISLDPERDTPAKMQEFANYFYANSIALVPHSLDELNTITQNYGIIYKKVEMPDSAMKYSIAHSNGLFVFDKDLNFKGAITNLTQDELQNKLSSWAK